MLAEKYMKHGARKCANMLYRTGNLLSFVLDKTYEKKNDGMASSFVGKGV
jgi:hypothetical protein